MNALLIRKDTKKIAENQELLNNVVQYAQAVYSEFKAINVTLTIEQIVNIAYWAKGEYKEEIRKLVVDHIIDGKGIDNFFGVPVNRKKIEEIIDTPDLSGIIKTVRDYPFSGGGKADSANLSTFRNYLMIENNTVKKVPDADATIESQLTHYTQNDKGVVLVNKLNEIIDVLNDYAAHLNDNEYNGSTSDLIKDGELKGLVHSNGSYHLNLDFIRRMEARA